MEGVGWIQYRYVGMPDIVQGMNRSKGIADVLNDKVRASRYFPWRNPAVPGPRLSPSAQAGPQGVRCESLRRFELQVNGIGGKP